MDDDQRHARANEIAWRERSALPRGKPRLRVVALRGVFSRRVGLAPKNRGAVGAAQIFDLDELAHVEREMKARYRRILDADLVARAAANPHHAALGQLEHRAMLAQVNQHLEWSLGRARRVRGVQLGQRRPSGGLLINTRLVQWSARLAQGARSPTSPHVAAQQAPTEQHESQHA